MGMAVFRQRILLQVLQYGVLGMTTFIHVPCTVLYCTTAVVNDEQYSNIIPEIPLQWYFLVARCTSMELIHSAYINDLPLQNVGYLAVGHVVLY